MTQSEDPTGRTEQVEDIRQIIKAVLAEQSQAASAGSKSTGSKSTVGILEGIRTYWPIVVGIATVGIALVAWLTLGVGPLDAAKEISQRKQQHAYQLEIARRHVALGNDFLNVGQVKAAEDEFVHAKNLDSYNVDADVGLVKVAAFEPVLEKGFDPELAERRIQVVRQTRPNDTNVLAFLCQVYTNIDRKKALQYCDQAIANDQRNAWAYYLKGVILEKDGHNTEALQAYEKAVDISPWNQTFINNAAYQYYLHENYREAEDKYILLLNLQGNFLISYTILVNAEWRLGYPDQADVNLEPLDEMLRDPAIFTLHLNQGVWLYRVDESGAMMSLYSPQEKTVYLRYLIALARQLAGNPTGAKSEIREAKKVMAGSEASKARRILDSDMEILAKTRPEYAIRLREFKQELQP